MLPRLILAGLLSIALNAGAAPLPIFDSHLHYSHDAWAQLPPKEAIAILRKAGLKAAMVSSSSDDGTQLLYAEAPDLVIPVLRPYRQRGDISSWVRDPTVVAHLESRLKANRYVAIGEYHVYGADADLPVVRRVVELARENRLYLHSHSDADAIERQFRQDPNARILWAHAGFDSPDKVREMLRKHRNLWCDLAFRSEHASNGKVDPAWRAAFMEFPDRFLVGTDTFTPERWHFVVEHANWSRQWLADLPPDVAERIAYKNGETLFGGILKRPWKRAALLLPLFAALPVTAFSCPLPAPQMQAAGVQAAWKVVGAPIAVGSLFAIEVQVCPAGAALARADATMPEHRHGMNYRPSVKPLGDGRWRVEGLMFHMPGRWELQLDVRADGRSERLLDTITLR